MASVTGMTASAIEQRLNDMIVSMRIDENGQVIYKTKGGSETNAGALVSTNLATERAWPIGSVYIGLTPQNPGELLGIGTWVRYANGRTLVGLDDTQTEFNAVNKVGGSKSYTLSISNIPRHNHSVPNHNHTYNLSYNTLNHANGAGAPISRVSGIVLNNAMDTSRNSNTSSDGGGNTGYAGTASPTAINNLPPYTTVYIWRRTA